MEARVSLEAMRDGLARTERQLVKERGHLADAERRGRLAAEIDDDETALVAREFVAKHTERVSVLERKREAQRAELALAETEIADMRGRLAAYRQSRPQREASEHVEAAWRELQRAGAERPGIDPAEELLRSQMDRAARDALADEQLQALKKKMGR